MTITIDHLGDHDWPTLRDLRLAALADAPDAFWATLEDESRYGVDEWTNFLRAIGWFVASRDGRPVGLVGGLRRREVPDEPEIVGMWVEPQERRRGTAVLLLRAVCEWAFEQGARSVALWVVDTNAPARRLYERNGFRATGERAALLEGRTGDEERMRRSLGHPRSGCSKPPWQTHCG